MRRQWNDFPALAGRPHQPVLKLPTEPGKNRCNELMFRTQSMTIVRQNRTARRIAGSHMRLEASAGVETAVAVSLPTPWVIPECACFGSLARTLPFLYAHLAAAQDERRS